MYYKVRFITRDGLHATAGLVFPASDVVGRDAAYLSRFFPVSEALKMQLLQISPAIATMEMALAYEF